MNDDTAQWEIVNRKTHSSPLYWNWLPDGRVTSSSASREVAAAAAKDLGPDYEVVQRQPIRLTNNPRRATR